MNTILLTGLPKREGEGERERGRGEKEGREAGRETHTFLRATRLVMKHSS